MSANGVNAVNRGGGAERLEPAFVVDDSNDDHSAWGAKVSAGLDRLVRDSTSTVADYPTADWPVNGWAPE